MGVSIYVYIYIYISSINIYIYNTMFRLFLFLVSILRTKLNNVFIFPFRDRVWYCDTIDLCISLLCCWGIKY